MQSASKLGTSILLIELAERVVDRGQGSVRRPLSLVNIVELFVGNARDVTVKQQRERIFCEGRFDLQYL